MVSCGTPFKSPLLPCKPLYLVMTIGLYFVNIYIFAAEGSKTGPSISHLDYNSTSTTTTRLGTTRYAIS